MIALPYCLFWETPPAILSKKACFFRLKEIKKSIVSGIAFYSLQESSNFHMMKTTVYCQGGIGMVSDKLQNEPEPAEFLLYQTEDGQTRLEVLLQEDTVWLTQKRMAELFQKNVRTVNEHIQNIFDEGELTPESVIRNFRITADDGKLYITKHYNLDVIISVGYRVKSHRGTQFRIWATQRLREFIIKGFTMDDDRLKRAGGGNYFDELLARIRDIRSAEKVFWRKNEWAQTLILD